MEVASPLSFSQSAAGGKRQFPCSPGLVDPRNPFDSSDEFVQQRSFKRRRFNMDVSMDGDSENTINQSMFHAQQLKSPFGTDNGPFSSKRSRTDSQTPNLGLQKIVDDQASEIGNLKHEKAALENDVNLLRSENLRVNNENKILKRAVTIQQERQNQASSELEAAHKYKFEAEDRMKKLEQVILSLRYHLTQHNSPSNDFMGFTPPDVY